MKNGVIIDGRAYEPRVKDQRCKGTLCSNCDINKANVAFCEGLCTFFGHGDCYFKRVQLLNRSDIRAMSVVDTLLNEFNVTIEELQSKSRKRQFVELRILIVIELIQQGFSDDFISKTINRDRTSLYYYKQKYYELITNNKEFRDKTTQANLAISVHNLD